MAVAAWLLVSIIKRCAERCALQLYHTSLTRGFKRIPKSTYLHTLTL